MSATTLEPNVAAAAESILLSLDALFAMVIYVFPKLHEAKISPEDFDANKRRCLSNVGQSVAMSNIGMMESRAAEAQASYWSNQSGEPTSSSTRGDSVDRVAMSSWGSLPRSPSMRRAAALMNRAALVSSMGATGSSLDSGSAAFSSTLFSAGLMPVGPGTKNKDRISMVLEGSGELSSTSFPAGMATISLSASLVLEDICDDMEDSEGDQVSLSEEECLESATATSCASNGEKASLYPMTTSSSAQKRSSTDNIPGIPLSSHKEEEEDFTPEGEKSMRMSSLFKRASSERQPPHSSSLQTTREDEEMVFHESFSSESDDNDFDSGGPRWSKPELNESLNRSVRIVQKWARK
jgi:hypothetical protein